MELGGKVDGRVREAVADQPETSPGKRCDLRVTQSADAS